jgi:maltooligosyltrehalose trehalohydrolase
MGSFEVWAPNAETVTLVLGDRDEPMSRTERGWWRAEVPAAGHGTDYGFRLDGSAQVYPDPRSRRQPCGVHEQSQVVDPATFGWTDGSWRGRPLAGSVIYELHVGTFTDAGTFDAAIDKLDHLVALGVDAVELLPVAAVAGSRNWGYDGVALYAVTENYGGPAGLVRFVDAAHARGIAVVLDVVYNHLGPSGNYLPGFGPYFGDNSNAWGQSINLDGPGSDEVRRFIVDNALMWLRDYHFDGLRLDAVHALVDSRAVHILEQLAGEVDGLASELDRDLWLIAESDLNDPKLIRERAAHGYGLSAQWDDDVHHSLHATLTGERQGYYVDFGALPTLAKALTRAFVHDGTWSTFRGRSHGRPADDLPGHRFVAFLQDHDQIGNRAQGDRLSAALSPGLLRVGAALLLCAPFTPMLFMGEEWGATTPWQFFCDPDSEELATATRDGRRAEFASHGWSSEDIPDPVAEQTFVDSRLDWRQAELPPHAELVDWYRLLIRLRREEPDLSDGRRENVEISFDELEHWFVMRRGSTLLVANLSASSCDVPVSARPTETLAASDPGISVNAETVSLPAESVALLRVSG